jgi:hypothetical protein
MSTWTEYVWLWTTLKHSSGVGGTMADRGDNSCLWPQAAEEASWSEQKPRYSQTGGVYGGLRKQLGTITVREQQQMDCGIIFTCAKLGSTVACKSRHASCCWYCCHYVHQWQHRLAKGKVICSCLS